MAPGLSRSAPEVTTRSPGFSPWRITASASVTGPSCTLRCSTLLSLPTTKTKAPSGPCCTATSGTTVASGTVSMPMRRFTKAPGQSRLSSFGNTARAFTVPVALSTWLSTVSSVPSAPGSSPAAMVRTGTLPAAWARSSRPSSCCGMVKMAVIGRICVRVTRPLLSEVCTRFPASTCRSPTRPSIGERITVKSTCVCALSMAAWSCATWASYIATWARCVSTCCRVTPLAASSPW